MHKIRGPLYAALIFDVSLLLPHKTKKLPLLYYTEFD